MVRAVRKRSAKIKLSVTSLAKQKFTVTKAVPADKIKAPPAREVRAQRLAVEAAAVALEPVVAGLQSEVDQKYAARLLARHGDNYEVHFDT